MRISITTRRERVTAQLLLLAVIEAGTYLLLRPAISSQAVFASSAQADTLQPFHWNKPEWAPTPLVPAENPMSDQKVALGRRLFYDTRLSSNHTLSCGSCHEQARAFTDGLATHLGVTGELGTRNAMTLTNVAYFPSYTWANPLLTTLEKQMQVPLFSDHPIEMGMAGHDPQLIVALQEDDAYREAFVVSFPEDHGAITVPNIIKAIAAFERTLLSFNSPYDRYKHGEPNAISESAKRGEALFLEKNSSAITATAA